MALDDGDEGVCQSECECEIVNEFICRCVRECVACRRLLFALTQPVICSKCGGGDGDGFLLIIFQLTATVCHLQCIKCYVLNEGVAHAIVYL